MKLTFDYYHNLEQVDLFLCNPDGRELFPLPGKSRNLTLRFNDLSELTFEVDSKITLSNNTVVDLEAYDYIQTKRLVYATNIGWFQISGVDEHDNGVVKYKTVKAESYQSVLKNKGFISEERVYCFYNPYDPNDDHYDPTKEDSIPSVIGQWSKQLGIKHNLGQGMAEPATPYDDWTVTYINSSLIYAGAGSKCRTFKENVTYGYDWMVNDVEKAFEVIILFDFMYKTIHVMTPNEVAQSVNVIYTFNNFMKSVEINEKSEDIVTVLNCNGDNCDITGVNPTGTNYICDFSYFMDSDGKWMSSALRTKINLWKSAVETAKSGYETKILQLRTAYENLNSVNSTLEEVSLIYTDLSTAVAKKAVALTNGTELGGIVWCETVNIGEKSMDDNSVVHNTTLVGNRQITAYKDMPSYNSTTKMWTLSGDHYTGTLDECYNYANINGNKYLYFIDTADGLSGFSYCVLDGTVKHNADVVNVPTGNLIYNTTTNYYINNIARINSLCDEYNAISNGNVDYHLRPFITPDKMKKYYPEFDGEIATTYTIGVSTEDSNGDTWTIDVTPILNSGDVLTEEELYNYCDNNLYKFGTTLSELLAKDVHGIIVHAHKGAYEECENYWNDYYERTGEIKNAHWELAKPALIPETRKGIGGDIYTCKGFKRYTSLELANVWMQKYDIKKQTLQNIKSGYESTILSKDAELQSITSSVHIVNYFADTPALLKELYCYWIEGDYTNDNIAVLEGTTPEKEIDLANELLDAGYIELSKVCQPRFSFSLESRDATKQYEFREQMRLLELGKIITIEKEEGLWYYPALLEISINLDNSDEFSMTFANAMRLDDWGYTYADLISDASSTSRKVSANWQDILAYAKERETVTSLIRDPLDMTLRAAFANMVNQEFTVDKNGILGRKKVSETSDEFEDEQVRLINNLLIFTDDNWETAKTALGKIYYTDDDGNQVTSYGLIAETIIGSLIMGERLKIKNTNSTVEIGAEGISIKKADGTVVFSAKPDGSLVVRNYASQSSVDSLSNRVTSAEASITTQAGQIALKASQSSVDSLSNRVTRAESKISQNVSDISAKVSQTYGSSSSSFGWSLQSTGFYVYSNASTVMEITSSGLEVNGKIVAETGYIGGKNGWVIDSSKIYCPHIKGETWGTGIVKGSGESEEMDKMPAFYAGFNGNSYGGVLYTPYEDSDWSSHTSFYVTHEGHLYARDAYIEGSGIFSGTITASEGSIAGWAMGWDGSLKMTVIRSPHGIYGRLSWTTTGADYRYMDGYIFTALTPYGLAYVVKEGSSYSSKTLGTFAGIEVLGRSFTTGGGGGAFEI